MNENLLTFDADRIKRSVTDVWAVLHAVGLADGAKRQARGALVRCPWHPEKRPSCSVRCLDGGIMACCFACGAKGDLYAFIAAARGLDVRRDFLTVKAEAARLAGLDGAASLRSTRLRAPRPVLTRRPPLDSVASLWARCEPVCENSALGLALFSRALDPAIITERDLARCLPMRGALPGWARCNGQDWRESGHPLCVPLWDAAGALASIHARSLQPDADPKGLSPAGHSSAGLVLADSFARQLLVTGIPEWWHHSQAPTILICEGVPDFLTNATHYGESESVPAVLGVLSGSWSQEVAARIPSGCRVIIRTHNDSAGQKYCREIAESLCNRCHVEVLRHG